jgi:hypothetical protein
MKNKTKKMTLTILLLSLLTVITNSSVYSAEKLVSVVSESDLVTSRINSFVEKFCDKNILVDDKATIGAANFFQISNIGGLVVLLLNNSAMKFGTKEVLHKKVLDFYNELATMLVVILMDSDEKVANAIKTDAKYGLFVNALASDNKSPFLWRKTFEADKFVKPVAQETTGDFGASMLSEILKLFGDKGKAIELEMAKISVEFPDIDIEKEFIKSSETSFSLFSSTASSKNSQEVVVDFVGLAKKMIDIAGLESIEVKDNNLVGHTRTLTRKLKIEEAKKYIPFNTDEKTFGHDVAKVVAKSKEATTKFVEGYNTGSGDNKITTSVVQECSKETQTTTEKIKQPMVLAPIAAVGGSFLGAGITYLVTRPSETSTTESSTQTESTSESAAE